MRKQHMQCTATVQTTAPTVTRAAIAIAAQRAPCRSRTAGQGSPSRHNRHLTHSEPPPQKSSRHRSGTRVNSHLVALDDVGHARDASQRCHGHTGHLRGGTGPGASNTNLVQARKEQQQHLRQLADWDQQCATSEYNSSRPKVCGCCLVTQPTAVVLQLSAPQQLQALDSSALRLPTCGMSQCLRGFFVQTPTQALHTHCIHAFHHADTAVTGRLQQASHQLPAT
jgi:hypothetical protein